jgi:hypothetical protein
MMETEMTFMAPETGPIEIHQGGVSVFLTEEKLARIAEAVGSARAACEQIEQHERAHGRFCECGGSLASGICAYCES